MYKQIIGKRDLLEKTSDYPFIVVHGFLGYGEETLFSKVFPYFGFRPDRNVIKAARKAGFEVYQPSVGPFNSMWDRACELYAQIIGGTVDYGKVHSEKFGHKRYGHTYDKPLVPDWGKLDAEGKIKKINLIGHSFGSPTTRTLIELLYNGSEEERAGTPENELSDLFKGGKKNWVHSCTLLAGCNGVSLAVMFTETPNACRRTLTGAAALFQAIGNTPFIKIYDFKMPQWGITDPDYKGGLKGMKWNLNSENWKLAKNFINAPQAEHLLLHLLGRHDHAHRGFQGAPGHPGHLQAHGSLRQHGGQVHEPRTRHSGRDLVPERRTGQHHRRTASSGRTVQRLDR